MLQKTFELQATSPKSRVLQLELGPAHITLSTFDTTFKPIGQLEHFNFKTTESQDWSALWSALKDQSAILGATTPVEKVLVTWENDQVQPIPVALYDSGDQEAIFHYNKASISRQEASYHHLADTAGGYVFSYSVPTAIYEILSTAYPEAIHQHKQAAITRKINSFSDPYPVKALLVFYQDHFILTTFRADKLQLILSRSFNHGADIVYHLLSAIQQAGYSPDQCCVYLSGLIDGDSALFKEIYKFVPVIDVDRMQDMDFLTDHPDYPSHFFVPFYKYIQDSLV